MVIVILLLTYRSPLLWLLPIISAVTALTVSQAVIYFLAKYAGLTVNGQSQGILTVLVFGAGTDYALLLVARYREELRRHEDRHEAMAFALAPRRPGDHRQRLDGGPRHALPALRRDELHRRARPGRRRSASRVALIVMVTLLPALLVIFGRWIFWPMRPDLRVRTSRRQHRRLGPGRQGHRHSTRDGSGSSPRCCWPSPAWASSSSTPTG